MLAQNFKSADELRITDIEHSSLITVLRMMERGEIKNFNHFTYKKEGEKGNPKYLYMLNFFTGPESECGTAACLAGWCHLLTGGKAFPELKKEYVRLNERRNMDGYYRDIMLLMNRLTPETKALFKLDSCIYSTNNPSVEEVATALRAYLTTGNPEVE